MAHVFQSPLNRPTMSWTVPALRVKAVVSVLGLQLHDITSPYRNKCVDSSVVCESGKCNKQMVLLLVLPVCVTDFSRSAEFSRNFGLKVICLLCYIKLMLSNAERTRRNLIS